MANSKIIETVRENKYLGKGSLSYCDEAWSDEYIMEMLSEAGISTTRKAVPYLMQIENTLWENELETKSNWEENHTVSRNWKAFVDAGYPSNKPVAEPKPIFYTVALPEGYGIHDGFGLCGCPCHTERIHPDHCWCFYEVDCRAKEDFDGDYQALRKQITKEHKEWEERESAKTRLDDLPF